MPPSYEDLLHTLQQHSSRMRRSAEFAGAGISGILTGVLICLTPIGVVAGGTLALLGSASTLYGILSGPSAQAKWTATRRSIAALETSEAEEKTKRLTQTAAAAESVFDQVLTSSAIEKGLEIPVTVGDEDTKILRIEYIEQRKLLGDALPKAEVMARLYDTDVQADGQLIRGYPVIMDDLRRIMVRPTNKESAPT